MTLRLTHTPCGQPIDLTDDNHILTRNTTQPHHCPGPAGPWTVTSTGRRWTLEFALDPHATQPTYDTHQLAQAEADRRNTTYERAHAPRPPQPQQAALFNTQEAS